jgi:hypothetical protein
MNKYYYIWLAIYGYKNFNEISVIDKVHISRFFSHRKSPEEREEIRQYYIEKEERKKLEAAQKKTAATA